jgi:hypothetical protein
MLDVPIPMQAALNFAKTDSSLHPDVFPIICQLSRHATVIIMHINVECTLRCFCNRALDVKILITRGTTSPARTVVNDTGEDMLALTLQSPRGPGFAFSYSGTGCGQKSMEGGNLAILPANTEQALTRQYPHLRVRTPTREIRRFLHVLFVFVMCSCIF